jgi:hypothetical protein
MDSPVLNDRNLFPSDELVFSHLGKRRTLWDTLFAFIHAEHPDFAEQWRYYDDGTRWLLNVSRKKKTVFWLAVTDGSFRITAYFTDKARDAVLASSLSIDLKEAFLSGAAVGKLRGITIVFRKKKDVEDAKVLIALKTL